MLAKGECGVNDEKSKVWGMMVVFGEADGRGTDQKLHIFGHCGGAGGVGVLGK